MAKKSIKHTDIEKWDDPWFRSLDLPYKIFWLYICDDCDIFGVWKVDFDRFFFVTRVNFSEKETELLTQMNSDKERILVLDSKYWFVKDSYLFQHGNSTKNNILKSITVKIINHKFKDQILPYLPDLTWAFENTKGLARGLQGASEGLVSPLQGGAKGERDKERERDKEKEGLLGGSHPVDNSNSLWRCPDCSIDGKIVEMPHWARAAHMDKHEKQKTIRG